MARRERRDGPPERRDSRDYQQERRDGQPDRGNEGSPPDIADERDTLAALKSILAKVAQLVRPLGLTPEESTQLVERLYEGVMELDVRLANDTDEMRRSRMQGLVQQATVRRDDGELVIEYVD